MDANEFAFTMKTKSAPPKPRKQTLLLIWLNIAQPELKQLLRHSFRFFRTLKISYKNSIQKTHLNYRKIQNI